MGNGPGKRSHMDKEVEPEFSLLSPELSPLCYSSFYNFFLH